MAAFRSDFREIEGRKVEAVKDYISGIDGLPPSDVLKYSLSGGVSLVVRPSGTEPKLKVYLSVSAKDQEAACQEERLLAQALSSYMDAVL